MYEETVISSCIRSSEAMKAMKKAGNKGTAEYKAERARLVATVVGSAVYVATLAAAVGYGLKVIFYGV